MTKKSEPDRHQNATGPVLRTGKGGNQGVLKGHKDPGKQNPNIGDQGPHGGGEGLTGMQPGAGHPRGR
jgi:hypothetical protein